MNKAELVVKVVETTDLKKKEAEVAVDAVFDLMVEAIKAGETVKISGFGIFAKKERAARGGTNPSNQEKITIPASASVSFKVSKSLKEDLNK